MRVVAGGEVLRVSDVRKGGGHIHLDQEDVEGGDVLEVFRGEDGLQA